MINKIGILDGMPIYEDPHMDEDKIYRGRKENGPTFLIVSTRISKLINNILLRKERRDKLNRLNEF